MFSEVKDEAGVRPSVRSNDLVIQEFENELLVYDLKSDRAHSLNTEARFVWNRCDGRRTVSEISELMSREFETEGSLEPVFSALAQFEDADLLVSGPESKSRRKLIKNAGALAVSLPVVMSLAVPASAQMTSCVANGGFCDISPDCCSGFCGEGVCVEPGLRDVEIEIKIDKMKEDKFKTDKIKAEDKNDN